MSADIERWGMLVRGGDLAAKAVLEKYARWVGVHPDVLVWGCDPGLPSPPLTIPNFIARYREQLKAAAAKLGMHSYKTIPGKFLLASGDLGAKGSTASCEIVALMCSPAPALGLPDGAYDVSLYGHMPIIHIEGVPHIKGEHGLYVRVWPHLADLGAINEVQRHAVLKIQDDLDRTISAATSTSHPLYTTRHPKVGPPPHPKHCCRLSWKRRPMSWYCTMSGWKKGRRRYCFPYTPSPLCP